jgi:tight adherence protein B
MSVGLVGLLAAGMAAAAVILACWLAAPRPGQPTAPAPARHRFSRRETRRVEHDLAALLEGTARGVRAGLSLPAALVDSGVRLGGPIGADMDELRRSLDRGLPFADAAHRWSRHRARSPTVRLSVDVLLVAAAAGGRASLALEGVAATLRERAELAGEVRSHAAQARASAAVMLLLPPGFLVVSAAVDPRSASALITTTSGVACLSAGLALNAAAALWMRRIINRVTP